LHDAARAAGHRGGDGRKADAGQEIAPAGLELARRSKVQGVDISVVTLAAIEITAGVRESTLCRLR
jgi:hypothetical protein